MLTFVYALPGVAAIGSFGIVTAFISPEVTALGGFFGVLFTYTIWFVKRSDRMNLRYMRHTEYERDYWRAKALGDELPTLDQYIRLREKEESE